MPLNIIDLDTAVELRDKIRRKSKAINALRHGNPVEISTQYPTALFSISDCMEHQDIIVSLIDSLTNSIERDKKHLVSLGVNLEPR